MLRIADHSARASRRSRDLDPAERTVVWFVRRTVAAGVFGTARSAERVFGPRHSARALSALGELALAARRSPLAEPPVNALNDPSLSVGELDLIAALAAAQHRAGGDGDVDRWGWPAVEDARRVANAVQELAELLGGADQIVPRCAVRRALATQPVESVSGLDPRERALVDGMRSWVAHLRADRDVVDRLPALPEPYAGGMMPAALGAVLRNTTLAARRPVDIRWRGCLGLSPDEARVVHAVALAQRERCTAASALLGGWLLPRAVPRTVPAIEGVARAFTIASHRLPLRYWRFSELDAAAPLTPVPSPGPATRH